MRPLADPEEIKATAARILGEYLGADRCAYAEIEADENYLDITCDYTRGATPSIVGRFGVDDLGPEVLRLMRMDLPSVFNDIEAEASAKTDLSAFRRAEIQALVCAPIIKHGHFVARMSVQQKTPRRWLCEEIEIIRIVATRCWESVARARVLRRVREGEERLRRITDATHDALWEINLKTRRLWWSEGARPLFGHGPGDLEIGLEDWYGGIHPEDVDLVRAKFETFMRSGDPDWIDEYRFRRADGSYAYIQDRGRKFFDEGGTPVLVAGAMVDITEHKQDEEAIRKSEENARWQLAYVEAIYATAPVGLCFVDTEQRFLFDECGAEVITADSVSEALEALERFRPDALVSDIAMPNQDGYDLIRQVRSRGPEQGGKIPAVAVTAYASAEDRVRVLSSGFQTHVSKPIDPGELIVTVASLTGHIHF